MMGAGVDTPLNGKADASQVCHQAPFPLMLLVRPRVSIRIQIRSSDIDVGLFFVKLSI
jgi:hypothetical protein